ncbi:MAG: hypothetical protein H6R15_1208 [Proteobacteria bacterium]|nr:hypothetical protein [Pseudomonadota bacterium]
MFSKKIFFTQILPVALLIFMRMVSSVTADASYFILAIYALFGRVQIIQALALSWLFTFLNPGISPEVAMAGIGRYFVLASSMISIFFRSGIGSREDIRVNGFIFLTLLGGVGVLFHSIIFSRVLDVSLLKAISWIAAFVTLFSAWKGLCVRDRELVEKQIFGGLLGIMFVSIPLLVSASGYFRNEVGFQGVLNHPQAFGATMALLGAWLLSRVFVKKSPSWIVVLFFIITVVLIFLSMARTAGLGLLLAIFSSVVFGLFFGRRKFAEFLPGLQSGRVKFFLFFVVFCGVFFAPFFVANVQNFILKGGENSSLAGAYESSRGFLIERMIENIKKRPYGGIGFGMSSDPEIMDIQRDPVFGLPTGAPVEKGVGFLAIWEEIGLFGFLGVLGWLWIMLRRAERNGGLPALMVCMTVVLMNFGEFTLFSAGGMGMLSLILITWASSGKSPEKVG